MRDTRSIRWLKAARKDFEAFPSEVQLVEMMRALSVASEGEKADIAKPPSRASMVAYSKSL
jgi:hypothetical protein